MEPGDSPVKSKHSFEFVRVLKEYKAYVYSYFNVTLWSVRTGNDPCFTDNYYGPARNSPGIARVSRLSTRG